MKFAIGALLLALGFSGALFAQRANASVDPFEIQKRINSTESFDVAALWQSLGIPAQLKVLSRLEATDSVFNTCRTPCTAEISRENLDSDPAQELILKVSEGDGGDYSRYLFFKSVPGSPNQWRCLGSADHNFARHYMPTYSVAVFDTDKRFFVMHAQGTSGTGISLKFARWYEVSSAGVREILTLPESGSEFLTARSVTKQFSSAVSSYTSNAGGDRFTVTFTIKYGSDYFLVDENQSAELSLFSRVQHAIYVRPKAAEEFTLIRDESDITPHEIQTVFDTEEPGCVEFIGQNINELLKIAEGPKSRTTEWLQRYAEKCEPIDERTRLLDALR